MKMCENSEIPEQHGECDSGEITQNYQPQYTDLHKLPISLKLIKGTHCQCCFLGSKAIQQVCTVSLTLVEGFFLRVIAKYHRQSRSSTAAVPGYLYLKTLPPLMSSWCQLISL